MHPMTKIFEVMPKRIKCSDLYSGYCSGLMSLTYKKTNTI